MAGLSGLGAEGLVYHGRWMRARLGDYSEDVQARLLANQFILAADYARALRARRLLRERYDAALARVDLLAAPTVPVPAPTIAEAERDWRPRVSLILSRNTRPANLTGLPAISAPVRLRRGPARRADADRPPVRGGDACCAPRRPTRRPPTGTAASRCSRARAAGAALARSGGRRE